MVAQLLNHGYLSGRLRALFPTSRIRHRLNLGAMVIDMVENAQAIEFMAGGKIRITN